MRATARLLPTISLLLLLVGCASDDGNADESRDAGADAAAGCAQVPAACVTEFCSWRTCGGGSIYGDQGCLKTQCKRESDCGPGEKCRPRTFNTTNCVKQQMGGCECTFGLSLNKKSFCLPSDTVTPCAECDGAALTCTKPGVPHEAAGFPLTIATATTCGGIKDFGTEELTVRCDTQELCSIVNCEKYTFDGSTLVTPSGLKCRVTPALP